MGETMKEKKCIFKTDLPVSLEEAFAWHLREGALERLIPPWINLHFLYPPAKPDEEGQVGLLIKWGPFSFHWILGHRNFILKQEFSDVQIHGPFRHYCHRHRFFPIDSLSSQLSDEITFSLPLFSKLVEKQFARFFAWRQAILKADLKWIDRYPKQSMRILLSGSSGFVGSKLKIFLQLCGHEVICLTRRKEEASDKAIHWDPIHGNFQKEDFEGFDAVIHLAGANLGASRWNKERKEQFFLTRCRDTWLLAQVLCRLYRPPKTLICASAIGFYGDRGIEELTEDSPQGQGFLADLCGKWEKASESIENRGTRVVHARFGAVLGAQGGMLQKMLLPFRLGLGGKIGSGNQVISWIGIDDLLSAIYHVLMNEDLHEAVNMVAPQPVSQKEFAEILSKKVHRPAFCHIPAGILKLALGEMAKEMILSSQKVIPSKLLASGYEFRYPDLSTALDFVM